MEKVLKQNIGQVHTYHMTSTGKVTSNIRSSPRVAKAVVEQNYAGYVMAV